MEKPKLKIEPKRYGGETSVVSMRMPKSMVADLEKIAEATGRTRNEVMMLCLEYAIDNLELNETKAEGD